MASQRWRRVTTSFIEIVDQQLSGKNDHYSPLSSFVILCKRSEKVNSFPHHWASFSGSIERNSNPLSAGVKSSLSNTNELSIPTDSYKLQIDRTDHPTTSDAFKENAFECAIRELEEETQLKVGKQLQFIRSGRVQWIPSYTNSERKGFIVYPFLFRFHLANTIQENRYDRMDFAALVKRELEKSNFKIDWEHDTFDIFNVEKFLHQHEDSSLQHDSPSLTNTVPNLRETLQRVFFTAQDYSLAQEIETQIVNNFTDGASQIALKSIEILKKGVKLYGNLKYEDIPDFFKLNISKEAEENHELVVALYIYEKLRDLVWHLDHCRKEMPSTGNLAIMTFHKTIYFRYSKATTAQENNQLNALKKILKARSLTEWITNMEIKIEQSLNQIKENSTKISTRFLDAIQQTINPMSKLTILTHSWSSNTLLSLHQLMAHCCSKLDEFELTIFVTESRPENEGYNTAKELLQYATEISSHSSNKCKIKVQVCTEASVGYLCRNHVIDAMVVGSDSIHMHDDHRLIISNKTGTCMLHTIAEAFNIPFFLLSDSLKVKTKETLNGDDGCEEMITSHEEQDEIGSTPKLFKQPLFESVLIDTKSDKSTTQLILECDKSLHDIQLEFDAWREDVYGL
ncbi:hypothetical protein C9374_002592 [Naegleria lovaniensis]|uniref:Nudix hydrolase domain-containing protein n=1 Tax=Naegleria lovaniensis TaxID=51637 RepID=A0AA88GPU4_NAELO|nr:uncharacterized protein C9374_002592 [Naegleria lovaniensis]KAG2386146.1 hypothetical protein C9374_002592 [Naegleria lovaniensis]